MAKEKRLKILEREGSDECSNIPREMGGTGSVVGVAGSAHGRGRVTPCPERGQRRLQLLLVVRHVQGFCLE